MRERVRASVYAKRRLRVVVGSRVGLLTTGTFCFLYIILYPVCVDSDWVWSEANGAPSSFFKTLRRA